MPGGGREAAVLAALRQQGAMFFGALHDASGGGYPGDTVDALWALAWRGFVSNDAFHALRAFISPPDTRRATGGARAFRSRREAPPQAAGRWVAVPAGDADAPASSATRWASAFVDQLLARNGVVTREVVAAESIPGGFGAIYPVLRALEDAGRIRRGYFVGGVAATQFAQPSAIDLLRSLRDVPDRAETVHLASTDPGNPYGSLLRWPATPPDAGEVPPAFSRSAGTSVILVDGALAAFLRAGNPDVAVCLPEAEPDRSRVCQAVAGELADLAARGEGRSGGLLIGTINGRPAARHPLAAWLTACGFVAGNLGYARPRPARRPGSTFPRLEAN